MAMRHRLLPVLPGRIDPQWSGPSLTMVFAEETSRESTGRGKRRPQLAKESRVLGLSGLSHRRRRKRIPGKRVGSHVRFAEREPRVSRTQVAGIATLSQLSIAEVVAKGFLNVGIVVTEPPTLRVVAGSAAPGQRTIALPAAPGI